MDHKQNKIALSLPPIEISKADYDKLKEASGADDPTLKITAWIKYLLSNQANGGITLSPADLKKIETAAGTPVNSGRNVVDIAMKAVGRAEGQYNFNVQLDEAWIGPAEETAKAQGVTLEHLISDAVATMMGNGWLYSWVAEGGTLRFSKSDWAELCAITGKKNPFGSDVVAELKAAAVSK